MASTNVWVDDRDPRVRFNGVWPIGGTPREFHETVSSSTRVGDSFVVPFYGQSIVVYGTIDDTSGGVVTNYSIDGATPVQAVSQAGPGDTLHQQFWMSPVLNITQHELTVTMVKVNSDAQPGEGTIWFDYFIINDPSGHQGGVSPPHKIITTTPGAIAGIVLGGFVILAGVVVAACLVLWFRRRRRRLRGVEFQSDLSLRMDREMGGVNDEVERGGCKLGEERGEGGCSWPATIFNRPRPSRSRIQPFILGLSLPQHPSTRESTRPSTSDTSNNSHRKGDLGTTSPVGQEARSSGSGMPNHAASLSWQSAGVMTMATTTTTTTATAAGLQSPHHHSLSTDSGSGVILEPRPRKHQRGLHNESSSPSSSSSLSLSSPSLASMLRRHEVTSMPISVSLNEHSEDPSASRQPVIAVAITEIPAVEASASAEVEQGGEEVDSRLLEVAPVQHVDSGVRLGVTAPRLPAELPPVYSPT